jgi:flagellar biosynthesis protein FlhF
MRVKSFHGGSIKEALDKARAELGPDAAIVASRQLRPEEGKGCEVVCCIGQGEAAPVAAPVAAPAVPPAAPPKPPERRRGVTRIRRGIQALVAPSDDGFGSAAVQAELLAAGFPKDLADEIVAGVRQRQRQGAAATQALREELSGRLCVSPQLGGPYADRRVVAFVGPPGAGKTTSLVKLAVRYGLKARKPVVVVSMDSWRVGGTDSLRAYAAGMGVRFESCDSAVALRQFLDRETGKGLILIDTPGMAPADVAQHAQLAALLSSHPAAETQLVIPATLSVAAMKAAAKRFQPFLPAKLLINFADCVDSCLTAVALSIATEKPVSFIGTGQSVPEDIEEAAAERLLAASEADSTRKAATSAA